MIVGKTSSSISRNEIFSKFSESQILSSVFPEITSLPYLMCSPLRQDKHPSFSIYMSNGGHIYYKDHATGERGGLLDLLCNYWNCTFNQVLDKLCTILIGNGEITIKPKQIKTLTRKEADQLSKVQVVVRPWRDYDYEYWASYGVEKQWLKYAEIYPISHKIITKKDPETGKSVKHIFNAPKYSYCYVERKENKLSLKIYSPLSPKYKWCSKMDASVISLWTKVPEFGDKIIIASSTKDALCISCNLHIPAIAPQGEGYHISKTAINELKRRYKQVYISYDGDDAGKEDALKLSKATGFLVIQCPILNTPKENNDSVTNLIKEGLDKKDKAKDWSDIYFYFGKERFTEEFNKAKDFSDGRSMEKN